jgi:predicted lysophospholipase L1 biosynthesis ABC-type transport system permease subunit
MMSDFAPIRTIAAKDIRDALRDRFILIVTAFLGLAAVVALLSGAIALRSDVATYEAAKATLLSIGKSVDGLKAPEFYPLRLLRGAIEQIEIIGAAIAILIGYRAAASERGAANLVADPDAAFAQLAVRGGQNPSGFWLAGSWSGNRSGRLDRGAAPDLGRRSGR